MRGVNRRGSAVSETMVLVCALLHVRWGELSDKFSFFSFTLSWSYDGGRWLFVKV